MESESSLPYSHANQVRTLTQFFW